jgi:hypothetical protein
MGVTSYVMRGDRLVNKRTGEPVPNDNTPIAAPRLARDYASYQSPVGNGMIEGRAAHREDLKRSGCRVMEKGEWNPVYRNAEFARKRGLRLEGE